MISYKDAPLLTKKKLTEVLSRFSFHKPDDKGIQAMRQIRLCVRGLAAQIECNCPESREKATALTQLSFVMMAANSAIVQQYPIDESDLTEEEKGFVNGKGEI